MRPIFFTKGVDFLKIGMYNKFMTTTDQLLIKIVNYTTPTIEECIPKRDAKVLRSLSTAVLGASFLTENQGKLLLKILKENCQKIEIFKNEITEILENPSWSRNFRVVEIVRRCYIINNNENQHLAIEFTFSSSLRKTISNLNKKIAGLTQVNPGKLYHADLTEKNIFELVPILKKLDFEIDEKIENFYEIIKSWSKNEVKNQFRIDTIDHSNFQKHISHDLGLETPIDQYIINDRSNRYQYFSEKSEKNPENLTEIISNRNGTKCWINKKIISLDDIFSSLKKLKRFPVLIIFDTSDAQKCVEDLEILRKSLKKIEILDDVGIYFRLDNDEIGKEFNQIVAKEQYNCKLDSTTKIVGIANGKIPKFLLNTNWTPMSVISLGKNLQNNKTSVYTNRCDLVLNWSEQKPINEAGILWG